MQHPIERFMLAHGLTRRGAADLFEVSYPHLCNLILGWHQCGGNAARKIEAASKGEITIQELLTWVPAVPPVAKPKRKARKAVRRRAGGVRS